MFPKAQNEEGIGPDDVSGLVVIAPNWLGDAVMALPAFADLRRHFPSAHLAVAARPSVAPMYTMVSGVDAVITLPGGGGLRAWTGWREDVRALARGSFDTAILFPNSYGTARIASKANIAGAMGLCGRHGAAAC